MHREGFGKMELKKKKNLHEIIDVFKCVRWVSGENRQINLL